MRGSVLARAAPSVLAVAVSLVICFVAIALTVGDVGQAGKAYLQMLLGGIGDLPRAVSKADFRALAGPWGETGAKAALLTLTGLSVAIAFRVGLFNIGAQGQMMVGALLAAVLGAQVAMPGVLHVPLCLLGAAAGGGLYALLPAVLKLRRGVHEVISTIMLNWIASNLIENWLVVGPLRATAASGQSIAGTTEIHASAHLPRLLGELSRLHAGLPVALGVALLLALWLGRTRHGYETRAVGLSREAAHTAGIPVARRTYEAMAVAGALAGLSGAVLVLGTEHKFPATLGAPYGLDGIAIALIGQGHPVGVAVTGLFFGALRAGGTRMQLFGVHQTFPELIQGLALLLVAGRLFWERLLARVRRAPAVDAAAEAPRA